MGAEVVGAGAGGVLYGADVLGLADVVGRGVALVAGVGAMVAGGVVLGAGVFGAGVFGAGVYAGVVCGVAAAGDDDADEAGVELG